MKSDFTAKVLAAVRRIPRGRVATYGDVAALAGKPRAARAVGNIMKDCGRADVPCHRVIAAGGRLGGYGGNEVLKRALLVAEGVDSRRARQDARLQNYTVARSTDTGRTTTHEKQEVREQNRASKLMRVQTRLAPCLYNQRTESSSA